MYRTQVKEMATNDHKKRQLAQDVSGSAVGKASDWAAEGGRVDSQPVPRTRSVFEWLHCSPNEMG